MEKVQKFLASHVHACDVCGATGKLALGSTHRKSLKPSLRCMQHIAGLREVIGTVLDVPVQGPGADVILGMAQGAGGTLGQKFKVSDGASPPASDDAAWFRANPSRTHRVRDAFPGELPGAVPGRHVAVLVRQVEPGKRIRRSVNADGPIPDDDELLAVIFDMPIDKLVNVQEATARAELRTSMGGTA